MSNNSKGPLTRDKLRRLQEVPDCLPEEETLLDNMQKKLSDILEDIYGFLTNLFETEGNQKVLDRIGQRLDVQ